VRLARTLAEARREVGRLRGGGARVGFVPTMGALHAGHESLVERARRLGAVPVLSVFVNSLQFGPGEDFESYPRDLERDATFARRWGVALLFAPEAAELVPSGSRIGVDPGPLGERLEGRMRPGHFRGVLTIVAKLLNVLRPELAVFGQKDLQQAVLVKAMVRELNFEVEVEVAPTVREPDGLALSSRNAYLSGTERAQAPVLYRALQAGERAILSGERDPRRVREEMLRVLVEAPAVAPDYVAVLDGQDLSEVEVILGPTALALAARLGPTRLIDNVLVNPEEGGG
jgi:pantoate--beta-alanine ligase